MHLKFWPKYLHLQRQHLCSGMPGHQQRRQAEDDENALALPNPQRRSRLATHLILQFLFGLLSATAVQHLARCAVLDHEHSPHELQALSEIGANGVQASNCYRDLMTIIRPELILEGVYKFQIPMLRLKNPTDQHVRAMDHSMVAPHLIVSSLWESNRAAFMQNGPVVLSACGD